MTFLESMTVYFEGERAEGLYFIVPAGVLSVMFALALLLRAERSPFVWGVAAPFAVLGLALAVVGGTVALRTPSQVATLRSEYAASRESFAEKELARMRTVNGYWPVYVATWAAFGVIGLGLRFGVRHDVAHGIGSALVFFAGVGLLIDGFAERRARPYTEALEMLARAPAGV